MIKKISLTAVILTFNEELHLERCLESLSKLCTDIVVVDSFSTDKTELIAKKFNVRFYQNDWINYSSQFNWALNHTEINTEWVLRIDADEYLTQELSKNIHLELPKLSKDTNGVLVKRLMYFLNRPLRKGGMYPIWHLKIWRNKSAYCEQSWMDEKMKLVDGETVQIMGDLVDHNLNDLTWWTQKHNSYATREAIDILNKNYNFNGKDTIEARLFGSPEERRRWIKMRYLKMPLFIRPFIFFIVRYFFQLAFLEGKRGFIWTVLQCFWYRFLVDAKIYEAYRTAGKEKEDLIEYFKNSFGYDITNFKN